MVPTPKVYSTPGSGLRGLFDFESPSRNIPEGAMVEEGPLPFLPGALGAVPARFFWQTIHGGKAVGLF